MPEIGMDDSTLFIREATREDLPSILDMYQGLETEPSKEIESFDPVSRFEKMKLYPYHRMFVVQKDNVIIATFTLTIIEYLCHQDKNAAVMEAVVVDEAYRSLGIGKSMIAFAKNQCKEHNCYKMALSSNVIRERAHAFYENEGFKLHGYSLSIDIDSSSSKGVSDDCL